MPMPVIEVPDIQTMHQPCTRQIHLGRVQHCALWKRSGPPGRRLALILMFRTFPPTPSKISGLGQSEGPVRRALLHTRPTNRRAPDGFGGPDLGRCQR